MLNFRELFSLLGLLLLLGCGPQGDMGEVTGQITKAGAPVPKVWVEFRPAGARPAEGRSDDQGRYTLRYTIDRTGTKVGTNHVTLFTGGELDSRDNELSPRQEVHAADVEVQPGENVFDFQLK